MKSKPVTIDTLDISVHQRYAKDQESLDPIFLEKPQSLAPHFEISGLSMIYASKWEELFEIQKRSSSWADFEPPEGFYSQSNRFFSHSLMPDLFSEFEQQSHGLSSLLKKKKKRPSKAELFALSALLQQDKGETLALFEQDRSALLRLIESIEKLNKLLSFVRLKKLQYQKG